MVLRQSQCDTWVGVYSIVGCKFDDSSPFLWYHHCGHCDSMKRWSPTRRHDVTFGSITFRRRNQERPWNMFMKPVVPPYIKLDIARYRRDLHFHFLIPPVGGSLQSSGALFYHQPTVPRYVQLNHREQLVNVKIDESVRLDLIPMPICVHRSTIPKRNGGLISISARPNFSARHLTSHNSSLHKL